MPIKNKDGSTLTLQAPNPLMKHQELWGNKYTLHNCKWEPVSNENTEVVQQPVVVPMLEEIPRPPDDGRIHVWCLPAHVKEQVDKLYGQKYQRIKYGKKFMFEALVLEEDDLYMSLWTNTRAVTLESVIFPRNQEKRWWRVNSIEQQNDGYCLMTSICDFTPEFSS
jgi:hypothetical protein